MPGNVQNAVASTVMPKSLATSFARDTLWLQRRNLYVDGRLQTGLQVAAARKRWTIGKLLTQTQIAVLYAFYLARKGPVEAFYFYDFRETSPKYSYDEGGAALTGRYLVRFDMAWSHDWTLSRFATQCALIELA